MLIGAVFGPANAGIYNVAKRLRLALQIVAAAPVNGIAMPALAEAQGDQARFTTVLLTATTIVLAVCGPVFLGAAVVSRDIIVLVFGPQWAAAAPLFQWLAVGGLCIILMDYNTNVFLIRGRPRWTLLLALLNLALTLLVFLRVTVTGVDAVAAPFCAPLRARAAGFRLRPRAAQRGRVPRLDRGGGRAARRRGGDGRRAVAAQPALHELPLAVRLAVLIGGSACREWRRRSDPDAQVADPDHRPGPAPRAVVRPRCSIGGDPSNACLGHGPLDRRRRAGPPGRQGLLRQELSEGMHGRCNRDSGRHPALLEAAAQVRRAYRR